MQLLTTIPGRKCGAFIVFIALLWGTQTVAQTSAVSASRGSIVTSAYAQLPEKSAISVVFKEDSDLNARLLPVVEQELREHGHTIAGDAALVLQISLVIQPGPQPEDRVTVSGQGDNRGVSDARVSVKVDRNPKNQTNMNRYRLEADLIEQRTKPIWKGASSIAASGGRDRREVAELLVRSLLAELGTTVRNKPVIE